MTQDIREHWSDCICRNPDTKPCDWEPSKGHVGLAGWNEYIVDESGDIFRATAGAPLSCTGYRSDAQFMGSAACIENESMQSVMWTEIAAEKANA